MSWDHRQGVHKQAAEGLACTCFWMTLNLQRLLPCKYPLMQKSLQQYWGDGFYQCKESGCYIHKGVIGITQPSTSSAPPVKLKCRPGIPPAVIQGSHAAQKRTFRESQGQAPGLWLRENNGGWLGGLETGPESSTLKTLYWLLQRLGVPSTTHIVLRASTSCLINYVMGCGLASPTHLLSPPALKETACSSGHCSCGRNLLSPKQGEPFGAFFRLLCHSVLPPGEKLWPTPGEAPSLQVRTLVVSSSPLMKLQKSCSSWPYTHFGTGYSWPRHAKEMTKRYLPKHLMAMTLPCNKRYHPQ